MSDKAVLQLHNADNVVIVLDPVQAGSTLAPFDILAKDAIPRGHKAALRAIGAGADVVKYGQIIGTASRNIAVGEHVHVQNVSMADFDRDYAFGKRAKDTELVPLAQRPTFQGYRRPDGKVGTRNYVGIVISVNCSATSEHPQGPKSYRRTQDRYFGTCGR